MAKTPDHDSIFEHDIDLNSRTVWFFEDVTTDSVTQLLKALHVLSQKPGPIHLIMSTPGGEIVAGLALYDYIRSLEQEIIITVYGEAYSAGSFILQAGDIRQLSRHSTIMIHDGESTIKGDNRKTVSAWHDLDKKQGSWMENILLNTLQRKNPDFSRQRLQTWLAKDTIFDATTALELGLVDRII